MNRSDTAATQAFAQELGRFVSQSPSSFHAAATVKASLIEQGFLELDESESWTGVTAGGRYVVTRDGSVIAFVVPDTAVSTTALRIFGAHTDSPALKLKPKSSIISHGFNQVGVEVYGGALFNSFLDRDLALAGRIVLMDGEDVLVHTGPYLRVPQLAVHLDRAVNRDGLTLDAQKHLQPITGLAEGGEHDVLADLAAIAGINPQHIAGYDIVTVDAQVPQLIGARREFLASARLDNLLSTFAGLEAIKSQEASANDHIVLFVANDHEEVGSASRSGAAGPFLEDVLARLYSALGASDEERRRAFNRSIVVSSDVGHSVHPNYPERHDPANQPVAGKGPILKINADQRYATDARGAAFWARACAHAGIEYQEFVSHNSMPCGSTIGPITATRLGMTTVDVGVPILSMHSCRELTAVSDPYDLYLAATAVFSPEVSSIP
ncbi:M18 family aminopeptidase [Dermabacter hominis]|uniref:M18 family aminopeptidase n=1 Tax=Dermabacter hominis 1368 TaxID=1450519 RepID=A0ABR4SL26_9MICO|nr:aminopeptidase [Dermabacter hominis 1368]WIK60210.1 M18 family aminopeptidase [Dermabacter hominis]